MIAVARDGAESDVRQLYVETADPAVDYFGTWDDWSPSGGVGVPGWLSFADRSGGTMLDATVKYLWHVNDGPVQLFASKLKSGGEFRLATDDPTYLAWALMIMQRHGGAFEWLAERPKDFLEPSGGWIETRYGAKSRREGRRPYYLRYRRV